MKLESRIKAFGHLGDELADVVATGQESLFARATAENPWFTRASIDLAIKAIASFLDEGDLRQWTSSYSLESSSPKTIGVAMAGNIPLVGFHDALCVLISGNRLKAKLSSQDKILMTFVLEKLISIEPTFRDLILFEERLNDADAMIATGGNNTARYFEYYFRNIPHIIRKNRTSCAIMNGKETSDDLAALSTDVLSYFGLGCRNVSKLYVPSDFDFVGLMAAWEKYTDVSFHHKYANNYSYQRGIMLMNQISFYDNGVVLLKNDAATVSPISVLYYETYQSTADVTANITAHTEQLQCVVSAKAWYPGSERFGQAQFPKLADYADGVDTLAFLQALATDRATLQPNP